jgi:hypothetical protein
VPPESDQTVPPVLELKKCMLTSCRFVGLAAVVFQSPWLRYAILVIWYSSRCCLGSQSLAIVCQGYFKDGHRRVQFFLISSSFRKRFGVPQFFPISVALTRWFQWTSVLRSGWPSLLRSEWTDLKRSFHSGYTTYSRQKKIHSEEFIY